MEDKEKEAKKKRNIFRAANKYHEQIMILTFFPAIVVFLLFSIVVIYSGAVFLSNNSKWIVDVIGLVLIACLMVVFFISRNIVGAFGRIMFELDEIIAGRTKKIITTRPKDQLSKDILKRVNYLVKHYVVKSNDSQRNP